MASYAPKWLERRKTIGKNPLAETTAHMYGRYIDKDIAPSFMGKKKLTDLRRAGVVTFVDGLIQTGRGAVTIARILATVQSILTGAMKDELVPTNVARGVETPTITRTERAIWTPEELATFLEVAAEDRLSALFELALYIALRRGEVVGLRWSDVDLVRGVATIRHNRVVMGGEVIEKKPKTDGSAAEIELSAAALTALKSWKLRQELERAEWGDAWKGEGHVFTKEDGSPLHPSYPTRLFSRLAATTRERLVQQQKGALAASAMDKTEPTVLPKTTLHGLRHIPASYMWDSTGDLLAVSKALRHSSPIVTATVYTHMKAGKQRATFDTISGQLEQAGVHTVHTQPAS